MKEQIWLPKCKIFVNATQLSIDIYKKKPNMIAKKEYLSDQGC